VTDVSYLAAWVLGGSVAMIGISLFGLKRALASKGWRQGDVTSTVQAAAIVLAGWFAVAMILAWLGVYEGASDRMPTIQYGILIPIAIGAALIWRSETAWRVMDTIPQTWLVGVQVLRGLGAVFLLLYAAGHMPGLFALPAGIGDIVVAVLAPIIAWAHTRYRHTTARAVAIWNVLGITDLAVAVATGFATGLSPLQMAAFDHPNSLITAFPLVLIPTYLVPLWIVLHIVSLAKLRLARAHGAPPNAAAASA